MRYLALGDSYTVGEGVPANEQWPRQLLEMLEANGVRAPELVMIARTAWTADELCDAVDDAPPAGRFDLVTLMVGVNDQYRARAVDEFAREFSRVLGRALDFTDAPANAIVVSIPDWGAAPFARGQDRERITREVGAFNACARRHAERRGARWVDVTPASRRMESDVSLAVADGLHPSGTMYREWAALVLPEALSVLRRP